MRPSGRVSGKARAGPPDRREAKRVILEILRQAGSGPEKGRGLSAVGLAHAFWSAHLYHARKNGGYLTDWPLVRTPWGADIQGGAALLRELIQDGLVAAGQEEFGPFPVTTYAHTGKPFAPEAAPEMAEAVRQALGTPPVAHTPACWAWWAVLSRAWRTTPDGAEMDIYLDLIPDDLYEERRGLLEDMKEGCGDLFA